MKTFMRGALAGALGTWLMDLVTNGLLEGQSKESLQREKEASPNGIRVVVGEIRPPWR